ncbi:MAG: aminotransferase class III-fold pyridoxal phosphate-dependent enzyme [Bacteroidales bacterium]|nr:aminotransferase class III-fold pyridoxal phosphate-dependent enzyme [Bacteroidales bacterium]
MNLFEVYSLMNITPVRGEGCYIYDDKGVRYLDLYGGHAVISIGHAHPLYIKYITEQVQKLGFYSNSVIIPGQQRVAEKLGAISGYPDYRLFLCNSGAEANENAIKLASFYNGRKKVAAFERAFHGRTHGAVAVTDNARIQAPVNTTDHVVRLPWCDLEAARKAFATGEISSVIIEGIQGLSGIYVPDTDFMQGLRQLCSEYKVCLILDEIQSGYGRSGKFFAHQYDDIRPDLITVAKGIANGFPMAGVLIAPMFEARPGMLGTTFGGSPLACAAAEAVLDVMLQESLVENAFNTGNYLMDNLRKIKGIKAIRGRGLMIAIEMDAPIAPLRKRLIEKYHIFTGTASDKNVFRLLPPLCLKPADADLFLAALPEAIQEN